MTDPTNTGSDTADADKVGGVTGRRRKGRPRGIGTARCDRCERGAGRLRTRWPEGGICGTCFHEAVRTFGRCAQCDRDGMLPGRDGSRLLCRGCAGITTDLDCRRCGAEAEHYRRGICARCALREDLIAVLTPTTPAPRGAEQLLEALCSADRPESILTWKRHPQVASLLRSIGTRTVVISHEAFDDLGDGRVTEHLRELLVHHGALPHRDRDLARFQRWLDDRLDTTEPPWARRALEQYATWHHLREMNSRLDRGQALHSRVHYAKQEITEVGRSMASLHEHNLTLSTGTQQHLDRWLAEGPQHARASARSCVGRAATGSHPTSKSHAGLRSLSPHSPRSPGSISSPVAFATNPTHSPTASPQCCCCSTPSP